MEENLDALIEVIIEDMKEERLYKEKLYKEKEEIMGKLTEIIGNEIGIVSTIGDGIITIKGLKEIVFGEMIEIIIPGGENIMGIILNIEKKKVSAIIFTNDIDVLPWYIVMKKAVLMSVPTGKELLGRIVDPIGRPIDGLGEIKSTKKKRNRTNSTINNIKSTSEKTIGNRTKSSR